MSKLVDVGAVDDFPVDQPVVVTAEGREILVVRHGDDEFYATRNVCPHQLASFATGWITRNLCAVSADEFSFDDDVPVVHCPRHSWGYRLTDGVATADPSMRIRTFPAAANEGRVLIDLGRRGARERAVGVPAVQSSA